MQIEGPDVPDIGVLRMWRCDTETSAGELVHVSTSCRDVSRSDKIKEFEKLFPSDVILEGKGNGDVRRIWIPHEGI